MVIQSSHSAPHKNSDQIQIKPYRIFHQVRNVRLLCFCIPIKQKQKQNSIFLFNDSNKIYLNILIHILEFLI